MITIDQIFLGVGALLILAAGIIEKKEQQNRKKKKSLKIPYSNQKKYVEFIAFDV